MKIVKAYLGFLITFLVVDAIWIVAFAGNFYQKNLSHLLNSEPNFSLVGLFYLFYAAGAVYLIVMKAHDYISTLVSGTILGALTYGTFTITNYTLLNNWGLSIVITDILWGMFITAVCCCASYKLYKTN